MSDKASEPWKLTLSDLWTAITGGRKPLAILLVLLIFVIPGAYGLIAFYWAAVKSAYTAVVVGRTSIMNPDEENARNEWIAVVSYWSTEKEARDASVSFKILYSKYETEFRHVQSTRIPMWRDDILVLRDPQKAGRWFVGIDMYFGPSSQPVVSAELARIARLGAGDPEAQNTFQRMFVSSRALCYSQRAFERIYGRVDPTPPPKKDGQGLPYIACAPSEA
jgi:hypothetical protein